MEVKIGVQNASRELSIYTSLDADELQEAVEVAVSSGGVLPRSGPPGCRSASPGGSKASNEKRTLILETRLEPGRVLDGFTIGDCVHDGGMGFIYRVTGPQADFQVR